MAKKIQRCIWSYTKKRNGLKSDAVLFKLGNYHMGKDFISRKFLQMEMFVYGPVSVNNFLLRNYMATKNKHLFTFLIFLYKLLKKYICFRWFTRYVFREEIFVYTIFLSGVKIMVKMV